MPTNEPVNYRLDGNRLSIMLNNPDRPGEQVTFNFEVNDGVYPDSLGESPVEGAHTDARQALFSFANSVVAPKLVRQLRGLPAEPIAA